MLADPNDESPANVDAAVSYPAEPLYVGSDIDNSPEFTVLICRVHFMTYVDQINSNLVGQIYCTFPMGKPMI